VAEVGHRCFWPYGNGRLQCERRQAQLEPALFASEVGAPANELSIEILVELAMAHIVREKLPICVSYEYETEISLVLKLSRASVNASVGVHDSHGNLPDDPLSLSIDVELIRTGFVRGTWRR